MRLLKILLIAVIFLNISLLASNIASIKILDPKVTINQGKSNYKFKIQSPKGINGFVPKLSINYTSQSDNSLLGLDTKLLGVSTITRCGKTPLFNTNDSFCLDESPIVKIKDSNNQYLLFKNPSIKLIKYGSVEEGEYWEVLNPDGSKSIYGKNSNSQLQIPIKYRYYNSAGSNYKNDSYEGVIEWKIQTKHGLKVTGYFCVINYII